MWTCRFKVCVCFCHMSTLFLACFCVVCCMASVVLIAVGHVALLKGGELQKALNEADEVCFSPAWFVSSPFPLLFEELKSTYFSILVLHGLKNTREAFC